jgi:hypothetical protein
MEEGNSKALIIAFYLSKFDDLAYASLSFGNQTKTHRSVGEQLGVNPNSVKNMRDEFDPYHSNNRAGWYQRPLRPSRTRVFNLFSNLSELALRRIVLDILAGQNDLELLNLVDKEENSSREQNEPKTTFSTRAITGEQAEQFFIKSWRNYYPEYINIENRTKDGCGYDFRLSNDKSQKYVEVKGMRNEGGGVLFTDKEWNIAIKHSEKYDLFIVSNLIGTPIIKILNEPTKLLEPSLQTQTIIQVSWNVPSDQISNIEYLIKN